MRLGSLFSGGGGLDLGLEHAGMTTIWQVEKDPYARRVLAKHWPNVARYDDARGVGRASLAAVDVIAGGFPCQDLSRAASGWQRPGLDGERSGLWWEFDRIVGEIAPRFVVVENVDGVWRDWVPVVRRSLARRGYASVPLRVRAADVGAPFVGARVFVVAASDRGGESARALHAEVAVLPEPPAARRKDWGAPSSRALGVAHGVPHLVDRLRLGGNAVVPAAAEAVGHFMMRVAARLTAREAA